MASLESQLRAAESEHRSLEDERFHFRSTIETLGRQIEEMPADELEANRKSYDGMLRDARTALTRLESRLGEAERRVLDLRNALAAHSEDLEALENLLDRQLQGR